MSYNVQYKHTDRSAIDRRIAGLQAELDELTPNEDSVVSYPCPDTAKLNEKIADLQAQLDDITPTEGEVYPCTDTAILNAKLDNIQEQIDNIEPDPDDPTPDPEPTGDTSSYAEYCSVNLGGEWNSETNICTFQINGMTYTYGTDTIDLKIACDSTPDSYWDYNIVSCCGPECLCFQQGGTWDPVNNECIPLDTDYYAEYCTTNLGGEWDESFRACLVPYHDDELGDVTLNYQPVEIDRKIECDNTPGSTWNMVNKTCTYPNPEPTGDTSSYAEYCTANLGGEWNSETNICTFQINGMTYTYGTDTIDLKIACDSTPGSSWDYTTSTCCDPECACLQQGGTWDSTNNECTYPEPDPELQ